MCLGGDLTVHAADEYTSLISIQDCYPDVYEQIKTA